MKSQLHPTITAKLADVRPHGDFVLVRRCDDERKGLDAPASVLIADPGVTLTARGSIKPASDTAPRRGVVVAVGKGDRLFEMVCIYPGCPQYLVSKFRAETADRLMCSCGAHLQFRQFKADWETPESTDRCPMHVLPGDEVLYQFWANNLVVIDGQEYQFAHEESSILVVLEPEGAGEEWAKERGLA